MTLIIIITTTAARRLLLDVCRKTGHGTINRKVKTKRSQILSQSSFRYVTFGREVLLFIASLNLQDPVPSDRSYCTSNIILLTSPSLSRRNVMYSANDWLTRIIVTDVTQFFFFIWICLLVRSRSKRTMHCVVCIIDCLCISHCTFRSVLDYNQCTFHWLHNFNLLLWIYLQVSINDIYN